MLPFRLRSANIDRIGYSASKYRLYDPENVKIIEARNVTFYESEISVTGIYTKENLKEEYAKSKTVEIIENKCEGMIRLRDITDDFYTLDEKNYAIIGQRKKKVYRLGDEVKIKVKSVDLTKKQIDFSLVQ